MGLIDDFWQRAITDFGLPGPDKGKGGKYLLLPPGYTGEVPGEGYYVLQTTMNNYNVMNRGLVVNNDIAAAVEPDQEDAGLSAGASATTRKP